MNNETIWSNELNDFISFSNEYNSVPNWISFNIKNSCLLSVKNEKDFFLL